MSCHLHASYLRGWNARVVSAQAYNASLNNKARPHHKKTLVVLLNILGWPRKVVPRLALNVLFLMKYQISHCSITCVSLI